MANRWGNNGNSERLFLGGSKITEIKHSHEIKGCLHLGRKAMTNQCCAVRLVTKRTKKQIYHVVDKGSYSQSYGFSVVMHECESWTIKKAECQRTDAFKLWCWRRLLRVPWTARRSNQSVLKEVNPEYSLEELMLKLKLQYFGQLM